MIASHFDANWVENIEDRKNTSDACFLIGDCLVAWLSKKQNSISLSIAKVEYITNGSCCTQLLWMKQMLCDYEIEQETMNIHYDNSSAINISNNLVLHSHTKHIEIHHHFIKDLIEKKVVSLEFISTEYHLENIFTKSMDSLRFELLRKYLDICLLN